MSGFLKNKFVDEMKLFIDRVMNSGWEDGFNNGYNEGHKEGYNKGLKDGFENGFRDAEKQYGRKFS